MVKEMYSYFWILMNSKSIKKTLDYVHFAKIREIRTWEFRTLKSNIFDKVPNTILILACSYVDQIDNFQQKIEIENVVALSL